MRYLKKCCLAYGFGMILACCCGDALAEKPIIITTIKPIHSLVLAVAGDEADVRLLIGGKHSPHDFRLKPSQLRLLEQAAMLFMIAPHYETFLRRGLVNVTQNLKVVTLARNEHLQLLELRNTDGAAPHGDQHHHEEGSLDYHIWLNPNYAMVMVDDIAANLAGLRPEKQDVFLNRAGELKKQLQKLDAELAADLMPIKEQNFLVFHDAYQYLEQAYGLGVMGAVTLQPDRPLSVKQMKKLQQVIEENKVQCLFFEPQFSSERLKPIAAALEVRLGVLDPLGAEIDAGAAHYFSMMRQLAKNLRACLSNGKFN